jgi:hypothetical protein
MNLSLNGYTMRSIAIVICAALSCLVSITPVSGQYFWQPLSSLEAPGKGSRVIVPAKYNLHQLDAAAMRSYLSDIGEEVSAARKLVLPVPGTNNTRSFRVWHTPVMPQELQQKFPGIRTFTAVAEDNTSVTAKLDFTEKGFHAVVFDGANTYYIDPYSNVEDGYYTVYYKRDFQKTAGTVLGCELGSTAPIAEPEETSHLQGAGDGPVLNRQHGSIRRTFRLALSCTGEYALAVAGPAPTVSSVLSAMVTTLNRVNGIYERELSVKLELIANNDQLVYTSPGTDPFTANNNGGLLLVQNQNNTTAVIGTANFDIGHIFSTGGGGIAALGSVCRPNSKARGVTGLPNPTGDPFDVDFVAHEMGHQFGANHTFNRCSGTEEMASAYEPGSGSTIMGYAGICGPVNNLQSNSEAYFHAVSLLEIASYMEAEATCASTSAGPLPPTFPAIATTYTIPYLTPFELEAPEADGIIGDTVYYNWEQWDIGNFQQNETSGADFTQGPSFRSFFFDTSRIRIFPKIDSIIRNVSEIRGERLPAVSRTMHFKPSVRNIVDGFGTFDISDETVTLQVLNTGERFRVLKPNVVADTLWKGQLNAISWEVAQTDIAPVNTPLVDVLLSVDGGYTYPHQLASAIPNTGSAAVMIPDIITNTARIKIKGNGNVFFDISDNNIRIDDSLLRVSVNKHVLRDVSVDITPNPASNVIYVKGGTHKLHVSLVNTAGQVLWSGAGQGRQAIPVHTLPRGIYFVQVTDMFDGARIIKRALLQ